MKTRDATELFCCPYCRSVDALEYEVRPECRVEFTAGVVDHTEFWSASRDYHCRNCDQKFTILEDEMPPT